MSIREAVCHELENICKTDAYSVDYFRQILCRIQQKVLPPVLLVSPFRSLLWLQVLIDLTELFDFQVCHTR